jgi:peptide/nickel transport system permease protein
VRRGWASLSPTTRYVARRLTFLLITLWATITINFFLPRAMPGNPAEAMMAKFHGRLNPAALHAMELAFGITNKSLWTQYLSYWGQLAHANLGVSVSYFPATVSSLIGSALPWTLLLLGTSTVIAFLVGNVLGIVAAWKRGGKFDTLITTTSMFTGAFPYFWLALLVLYVLGFVLGWFPTSYAYSTSAQPTFSISFIADAVDHAMLPGLTIVVTSIGGWLLTIRNNMLTVLNEDYVTLARAKGLTSNQVMFSYAARNALLPNVSAFGMAIGFVLSGTVLTEVVFSYQGLGSLLYGAVQSEDYALLQGILLIVVVAVLVANMLADVALLVIDPRLRG